MKIKLTYPVKGVKSGSSKGKIKIKPPEKEYNPLKPSGDHRAYLNERDAKLAKAERNTRDRMWCEWIDIAPIEQEIGVHIGLSKPSTKMIAERIRTMLKGD